MNGTFDWRDYGEGIHAMDSGYERPLLAAIHLIVEDGKVAFVDTGSNDSLPRALQALERLGLGPDAVDYVILTHVHLDHAGGAGRYMQAFPQARLVVHPRGAPHMVDPSALVAGVTAVYGEDYVQRVYGEIVPVPSSRIIEAPEGARLYMGKRELEFFDTPGHARHHVCLLDSRTRGLFTGDMFGLSYREFDVDGRAFIFPTTTPTQFDPAAMRASILRLADRMPSALYLTHYAQVTDVPVLTRALLQRLGAIVTLAERFVTKTPDRLAGLRNALREFLFSELRAHGVTLSDEAIEAVIAVDLDLNAKGILHWLDTRK